MNLLGWTMAFHKRSTFVITTTSFGPMLVNRFDYYCGKNGSGFSGIGLDLMDECDYGQDEVAACLAIIRERRERFGDGVVVVDAGANIGTHTIPWAYAMRGWGTVIAIEAQERIFYALAGNITLNNCFNARAIWAAAAKETGSMIVPELDHQQPANFGGLSLIEWSRYDQPTSIGKVKIPAISVDSLDLPRLDFIKIDVQGLDVDVLNGPKWSVDQYSPFLWL